MVRRDVDGQTLYYIDVNGQRVQCSKFDWQYWVLLETQDLQIAAVWQNQQRKNNYLTALSNAQTSINAARTVDTPLKPRQIVVTDPTADDYGILTIGTQTEQDWKPELPELVPLKVSGK